MNRLNQYSSVLIFGIPKQNNCDFANSRDPSQFFFVIIQGLCFPKNMSGLARHIINVILCCQNNIITTNSQKQYYCRSIYLIPFSFNDIKTKDFRK